MFLKLAYFMTGVQRLDTLSQLISCVIQAENGYLFSYDKVVAYFAGLGHGPGVDLQEVPGCSCKQHSAEQFF